MNTKIFEGEESIQDALESLRNLPVNESFKAALDLLAPKGYHPVVELKENGRKKRRNAAIDNWTPETGEILIYFTPDTQGGQQATSDTSRPPARTENAKEAALEPGRQSRRHNHYEPSAVSPIAPEDELCIALEEVERQHWSFVALKHFRDDVLPAKGFAWASSQEERQAVLARAIEKGLVLTSKIPNPRSPFPTTTVRLNRSRVKETSGEHRFSPVRVSGESLSSTILRDRGAR